ncbi:MAG TPA: hypothetical protein VEL47_02300 [Myxococcota bacterium]|nr:hypothetical protein [Myxococcota bacterium]
MAYNFMLGLTVGCAVSFFGCAGADKPSDHGSKEDEHFLPGAPPPTVPITANPPLLSPTTLGNPPPINRPRIPTPGNPPNANPSPDPEQVKMRAKLEAQRASLNAELPTLTTIISLDDANTLTWWVKSDWKPNTNSDDTKKLLKDADWLERESKNPDFPKNKKEWEPYFKTFTSPLKYQNIFDNLITHWWPSSFADFSEELHSYAWIIRSLRNDAKRTEDALKIAAQIKSTQTKDIQQEVEKMVKMGKRARAINERIDDINRALQEATIYSWKFSDLMKPIE